VRPLLAGLAVFAVAALVIGIQDTPDHLFGLDMLRLSVDPFQNNLHAHRLLSPLLAHVLGLRGMSYKYFSWSALLLFFSLIYREQRKLFDTVESLLITALVSVTAVSYQTVSQPYSYDAMTLLLLLLAIIYSKRWFVFPIYAAGLFNHELFVFFIPLLIIVRGRSLWRDAAWFALATLPYIGYRMFAASHTVLTANYYFSPANLEKTYAHIAPVLIVGVFQTFKLSWLFILGGAVVCWTKQKSGTLARIAVALAGPLATLVIAWDITRLLAFAFPALIFAMPVLRERFGRTIFRKALLYTLLVNSLIPSASVAITVRHLAPFWA
jgi:hypothetical protein